MNRKQLENLCEVNGIVNFQLKNKEDLLKVFGIKVEKLEGFENLSDEHKELFTKFLINFYNMHGVDSKLCLMPISIHFVHELRTLVKDNIDNEYWDWFSTKVFIIDKDSNELKLFKHNKEKELQYLKNTDATFKNTRNYYLRFDYNWTGKKIVKEWLHVIDPNTWY